MEYAEQEVLEMLIPRYHARQILEVSCKLLQFDEVIRFYVIPTPNELVEGLLFGFLVSYHLWMSLGVKDLSQLLQSVFVSSYFTHSAVSIHYRFVSLVIEFASQIIEQLSIGHLGIASVSFHQVLYFFFAEKDLAALQTPSEILLIEEASPMSIKTVENFMNKPHPINSSFSEQMLNLFLQSKLVDYFILDQRLIKLLVSRRCSQNKPQILIFLRSGCNINGRNTFFLLIEVLSFVVDKEIMSHHLILLAKGVFIKLLAGSQPLVGHLVFNQNCLVKSYWLSCRLQSEIGIWVLEYPCGVEVVLKQEDNFLKP